MQGLLEREWFMSRCKVLCLLMLGFVAMPAAADIRIDPDNYRALTSDRRAYEVGDVLTVIVIESTVAESAAGTGASSSTDITAGAGNQNAQYNVNMSVNGDTSGTGQTSRRGEVRTRVAVRITDVEAGMLRIAGEQAVTVNDEKQHLKVAGLVRPDDIMGDNTVFSHRIAEADIEISGKGVVNQAQKPNVIFRILKWLRFI